MPGGYERQVRAREEWRRRRPEWIDSVSRYRSLIAASASSGAQVLDLGCGRNGLHGDDLGCVPGATVVGVDPDLAALNDNRVLQLRVAGSGQTLPFARRSPAGSTDAVRVTRTRCGTAPTPPRRCAGCSPPPSSAASY